MATETLPTKAGYEVLSETLVGLVDALAWPALLVFAIFFFGDSIKKLIARVKTASIAGNDFAFQEELAEVSEQIEEAAVDRKDEVSEPSEMTSPEMNQLFALGKISPSAAVMEAFKYVDLEWRALLESKGISPHGRPNTAGKLYGLSPSQIDAVDRLRRLRNQAAHLIDHGISPIDASNYVIAAFQMANTLRDIRLTATVGDKNAAVDNP